MKNKALLYLLFPMLMVGCLSAKKSGVLNTQQDITPYPQTVAYYQAKAAESQGHEALQYRLKETGRLLHDGMRTRAKQQLDTLGELPEGLDDEKRLLLAKQLVLARSPEKALKQLAKVKSPSLLSLPLQSYYHQLLANSYLLQGKALNSVAERAQLDSLLATPELKLSNRREIWRALSTIPMEKEQAYLLDAGPALKAWLSLNVIAKQFRDDGPALLAAVKAWQQMYVNSLANSIVDGGEVKHAEMTPHSPKQIALLVPLSGPLRGPGQALRDGFMARYYKVRKHRPVVRFYDTYHKNVVSLYKQAVSDGAEFVVGPLSKANVELLRSAKLSVPTIALNEIEGSVPKKLYQFSLSPQDEALQVATKSFAAGYRRALIIAPRGQWGEPIAQAFVSKWNRMGATITEQFYYDSNTKMDQAIKQLMHISSSTSRDAALMRTINKKVKFIPRRREDFDVVFLVAYPAKARQIRPLLRYYYAGDVPVYSTSLIYAGKPNPRADVDLNGIIFSDMPWLLDNTNKLVNKTWPEQLNSYNRLYALGQDSFLLSQQLNHLLLFPMMGLKDNTGTLYVDANGKISRQMEWVSFNRGVPKRLF